MLRGGRRGGLLLVGAVRVCVRIAGGHNWADETGASAAMRVAVPVAMSMTVVPMLVRGGGAVVGVVVVVVVPAAVRHLLVVVCRASSSDATACAASAVDGHLLFATACAASAVDGHFLLVLASLRAHHAGLGDGVHRRVEAHR